jgi:hypothetical protein
VRRALIPLVDDDSVGAVGGTRAVSTCSMVAAMTALDETSVEGSSRRARTVLTAPRFASREYVVRLPHRFFSLLLVVLVVGLTPAAYADPPDPTWIGGYWDDDDFDNVVAFIASTCAVGVLCTVDAGPLWTPSARVEPCRPNAPPAPLRSVASSRAPPASFTPYSS